VAIEEQIDATVIGPNQAIKLCAKKDMTDRLGQQRVAGEQWLVKKPGAYLPLAYETVVAVENAYVLTDKKALHLRALKTFTDDFEQTRNNGDEWLITREHTEAHILNVYEQLVKVVDITVVSSRQYCVILNPVAGREIDRSRVTIRHECFSLSADGKSQLGKKKLVIGEKSFFLQAGEQLEKGIQDVYILDDDEGLVMKCIETFEDDIDRISRIPG
jgi:major vault protein